MTSRSVQALNQTRGVHGSRDSPQTLKQPREWLQRAQGGKISSWGRILAPGGEEIAGEDLNHGGVTIGGG